MARLREEHRGSEGRGQLSAYGRLSLSMCVPEHEGCSCRTRARRMNPPPRRARHVTRYAGQFGGSVGDVVAPGTPVPPGIGGQLGSRVLVVSLQSTVLVRLDELSVCDAVPASARLLVLEVPLVEHPARITATSAAAVALAIPNCLFMTAPLHLDQ